MKLYIVCSLFFIVNFLYAEDIPFELSAKKKLKESDLVNKKEGWYPTGLPLLNSDPINGIGYGLRLFLYDNSRKTDPFFPYTPYRTRIYIQYFNSTKNAQYHEINLDSNYIFNTPWRLRASSAYDKNPNKLYFGKGENTLRPLDYNYYNQPYLPNVTNATYSDQQDSRAYRRQGGQLEAPYVTDKKYNGYELETPQLLLSFERSLFKGLSRLVFGAKLAKNIVHTYDNHIYQSPDPLYHASIGLLNYSAPIPNGKTKLTEDKEAGKITGYNGGYVNLIRMGIVIIDSRDFEPDPNRGVFIEATHERSDKVAGSDFQFNRNFTQGSFYYSPAPDKFDKLVIAGRVAFVENNGNTPFFEYRNMWGTAGDISGLGGLRTMRGYKQDRFIGRSTGYGNLELRWKFTEMKIGSELFAFNLVPFVDFGRVWDNPDKANLKDYKYSRGLGLRIAWNQATIIMIDYARSREDSQLFVNFNHIF